MLKIRYNIKNKIFRSKTMLKELEEMSIGQKLYDYQCKSCGFEKGVPEFLIEEFRMDMIFGAIAPLEDEFMPELVCPNCRAKFEYKKTDDRQVSVKVTYLQVIFYINKYYLTNLNKLFQYNTLFLKTKS